ncbi:histidine phosphatase family protein [Candidatus Villigracilis saccharophilus]|uniref:histidine phosphatase family protein n=1 Tax=Candidatus Villigracilis saccharophilus TaxID=3140684 RepID=UPI003135F575|nr:histidine phosphatase family protein [Anaerolineales bacterium]
MKLYFVRHGESEANTRHVISNRESPFGLTALGKRQAAKLAESLKSIPMNSIFSSPILRARETAEILSQKLQLPIHITESLREYDCGILEDKSDEASWEAHRTTYHEWTLRQNFQEKPEGGESFLDIQNRFLPFIEKITHDNLHADNHILLIGHGGLFTLMLPLVLTDIDKDFFSNGFGHTECVTAELCPSGLVMISTFG